MLIEYRLNLHVLRSQTAQCAKYFNTDAKDTQAHVSIAFYYYCVVIKLITVFMFFEPNN